MLNIKNPGTHSLAGERATRRGENLTTADDIMALVQSIQPHLTPLEPGEDPTAFLFDPETGLPG
ncbi:hypothetical protein HZ989_07105 [Brevundimonas sp. AJA228-03]|uniref:hypothetical protein n=1 Tax=Brevundimonas sp. AJA228-03 TaxID=2752515 RepID=UPI001ADF9FBD|nr:hypothetical protein [Brevundimonas sp. AJA228-03]QTN20803.1 hypothetical protein HZ989_07105 [Brevundimonas sp. AJA228-03]